MKRFWDMVVDAALKGMLVVLASLLSWLFLPVWHLMNAAGFDLERTSNRLALVNARTSSLEGLHVRVSGTVPSMLQARLDQEAMAEVSDANHADSLVHKFHKLADGRDSTLGRGSTLEITARTRFDFRRDVRELILTAKDGFSVSLESIEGIQPVKTGLAMAVGLGTLCFLWRFRLRVRRRLWPTQHEKSADRTLEMARGSAVQKERFRRAFTQTIREHLGALVVIESLGDGQIHHIVYEATQRLLEDADHLRTSREGDEVSTWVRRHTHAALHEAYKRRSAGEPDWVFRP